MPKRVASLAKTMTNSGPVEDQWAVLATATAATLQHAAEAGGIANLMHVWQTLDDEVGKVEDLSHRQKLMSLRSRVIEDMTASHTAMLAKEASRTPADISQGWLASVAEAVSHFRIHYAFSLASQRNLAPETNAAVRVIREGAHAMMQGRWLEAYEAVRSLSDVQSISDVVRARLLVILGQIELYRRFKHTSAKQLLEKARALAPTDGRVLAGLGECLARDNDIEGAAALFRQAVDSAPTSAAGYIGLGDLSEQRQQIDEAERSYREAMSAEPGNSSGYLRLLRLFGRRELFARRRAELEPLFERIVAIAPDDEAPAWLDLGRVYLEHEMWSEAQRCYDRSIALDPTAPDGYVAAAAAYEKQQRFDEATAAYLMAIEVAPEGYDSRFGLALVYEQQQQWEKALNVWQSFPQYVDEWAELARVRAGTMYTKLGDLASAERTLKGVLAVNKHNKAAKHGLEEIAGDYNTRLGNREAATRIYEELLALLGDSYRGIYIERIGYLYLNSGEIERSIKHFNDAIALNPNSAALYRSLGDVFERSRDYAQAAAQYERSHQLDGDTPKYNGRMSRLKNKEGNEAYSNGDHARAAELYELAIQYAPDDAIVLSNLGGAYERSNESGIASIDKAIAAYVRAQEIAPSAEYEEALERLRRKRDLKSLYATKTLSLIPLVTPIALEIAGDLISLVEGGAHGGLSAEMLEEITKLRSRLEAELGIPVPGIRVRGNETDLPDGNYIIMLLEVPVAAGVARLSERFSIATEKEVERIGATGTSGIDPASSREGYWLGEQHWGAAIAAGLKLWDPREYIVRHLESVLRRNSTEFVGFDEVNNLLNKDLPGVSETLRNDPDKMTSLLTVCRALANEEVPLRPITEVWREFDRGYSKGETLEAIVEAIRRVPAIRQRLLGADRTAISLGVSFQNEIANSIQVTGSHTLLAMEPERCQDALTSVRVGIGGDDRVALVVDDADIRPHVRRLIELEWPHVPVLARDEVSAAITIDSARTIDLDELVPRRQRAATARRVGVFPGVQVDTADHSDPTVVGITVFVSESFVAQRNSADDKPLGEMLEVMSDGLHYELGLLLPEVRVAIDNRLPIDTFAFAINGRSQPAVRGLQPDEFLVNDTPDRLKLLRIEARAAVNPASGAESAIVRNTSEYCHTCQEAGLTVWGPAGYLVLTLAAHIRAQAPSFLTPEIMRYVLDSHRAAFPDLDGVVQKRFTINQIRQLLQELLDEDISVRDLRSILTSMALVNGASSVDLSRYIVFPLHTGHLLFGSPSQTLLPPAISDYLELVRSSLKKQISFKYARGGNTLVVYLMDSEIEAAISKSGDRLREPDRSRLLAAVHEQLRDLPPTATKPVILTTLEVRKPLWKLLRNEFPTLAVVSYQELSADMNIQPIARIAWDTSLVASRISFSNATHAYGD